jgi:hypothetical protein
VIAKKKRHRGLFFCALCWFSSKAICFRF